MKLERRFAKLEDLNEVEKLIIDVWNNQDCLLILPYEENKIIYISISDDISYKYHEQGLLVRAKNFASIYDFMPIVIEEFKSMVKDVKCLSDSPIEKAEVIDRCTKIIELLSTLNPMDDFKEFITLRITEQM